MAAPTSTPFVGYCHNPQCAEYDKPVQLEAPAREVPVQCACFAWSLVPETAAERAAGIVKQPADERAALAGE